MFLDREFGSNTGKIKNFKMRNIYLGHEGVWPQTSFFILSVNWPKTNCVKSFAPFHLEKQLQKNVFGSHEAENNRCH